MSATWIGNTSAWKKYGVSSYSDLWEMGKYSAERCKSRKLMTCGKVKAQESGYAKQWTDSQSDMNFSVHIDVPEGGNLFILTLWPFCVTFTLAPSFQFTLWVFKWVCVLICYSHRKQIFWAHLQCFFQLGGNVPTTFGNIPYKSSVNVTEETFLKNVLQNFLKQKNITTVLYFN